MQGRIRFETAKALFDAYPTAGNDMSCVPTSEPPLAFLQRLLESNTPEEAVTFCAYLLGRREAVWWGCRCVAPLTDVLPFEDVGMIAKAHDWAQMPSESLRRSALAAGMDAQDKTPGAWLALAAGWSGGDMNPGGVQVVLAPSSLTPKAVNVAILAALARVLRQDRGRTLREFAAQGATVAERGMPSRQGGGGTLS